MQTVDYKPEYFVEDGVSKVKLGFNNVKYEDKEKKRVKLKAEGYEILTKEGVAKSIQDLKAQIAITEKNLPTKIDLTEEEIKLKGMLGRIRKYNQYEQDKEKYDDFEASIKMDRSKIENTIEIIKRFEAILEGFDKK